MDSNQELFLKKLDSIESLLKDNINEFKKETVSQIEKVWADQIRQDSLIQDMIQMKATFVEEFDDKLRASELVSEEKIDKQSKGWWKKAGIIYSVVILMVTFIALQGAAMKNEITDRVTRTEFQEWRKIEFSHTVEEIRDLRKEIKEEMKEFQKNLEEHLNKLKSLNEKLAKEKENASKRSK